MGESFGIVFQFRSRFFKLVDIEWGADNSFYFMPCSYESELGTRLKTRTDDLGRILLNINEIETGHFPTRKITRHPSGYYHLKDVTGSGGKREKDGLVGPAFKDTPGFYVFLTALPQSIETLVEVQQPQPTDIIANLPDIIEPFIVKFAVWNKNVKIEMPMPPGKYLRDGVIAIKTESLEFGMVIMFENIEKSSPDVTANFPVRTCYIIQ